MPLRTALRWLVRGSVAALIAASIPAFAGTLPPVGEGTPMAVIGPSLRLPSLELSDDVRTNLRNRRWADASRGLLAMDPNKLVGSQKGDWAFLVAWSLVHSDQAAKAVAYLPLIADADCVPAEYYALVEGEALRAAGKPLEALAALDRVGEETAAWPRAAVQRAEVLRELERTAEAWAIYEQLAARPDPAPGAPLALVALAKHKGVGSDQAYTLLRRVWTHYPRSDEAVEATRMLATYTTPATWQEVGQRAERLMDQGDYAGAILETERRVAEAKGNDVDACRFHYVRGRSLYRSNKLTASIAAFGDIGDRCKGVEPDYGARSLYLLGQAQFRTRDFVGSAASNVKIADHYPKSSFADDGLTHAGIALQELGDLEGALAVWTRALDEQPTGDTVPESTFRVGFALYMDGKPEEARVILKKLGELPLGAGWVDVAAGRYWAARLALYPDVNAPTVAVKDAKRRQEAIDGWRKLCEEMPHSFYAILAWSRLKEVAPEVAAELTKRPDGHVRGDDGAPWVVRLAFLDDPAIRSGVDLARLGLIQEARAEWGALDAEQFLGDEMAWLIELRIVSGDWLFAHDSMRKWLLTHPPGTLGERQPQILRLAYPDRYWAEVQKHAVGYRYEPRLFHALCREESNFNAAIVSHANARGLSQIMPATGREIAGWYGTTITLDQLNDPDLNAKFGSRYLEAMHKQLGGSPYLSLAAYNAGAGRVNQWRGQWGDVPTDEYIERIPFKETRGYVKRVMGTWQIMRWQFDEQNPAFYDLSVHNHHALVK